MTSGLVLNRSSWRRVGEMRRPSEALGGLQWVNLLVSDAIVEPELSGLPPSPR